jgi:hypothetical protein
VANTLVCLPQGRGGLEENTIINRISSALMPIIHGTSFSSLIIRQEDEKLDNEEFYNLLSSPDFIKESKICRRWVKEQVSTRA